MADTSKETAERILGVANNTNATFEGGNTLEDIATISTRELAAEIARRNDGAIVCWYNNIQVPITQEVLGLLFGGRLQPPTDEYVEGMKADGILTMPVPAPAACIINADPKWVESMLNQLRAATLMSVRPNPETYFNEESMDEITKIDSPDGINIYGIDAKKED